jgi:nucleotide-binding universal stress UspA family protein
LHEELQGVSKNEWLAERIAKERLERIAMETFGASLSYEVRIRTGEPVQRILDTAVDIEAHLIILATYGKPRFLHFFLGSITDRIVHESSCPVLTIPTPILSSTSVAKQGPLH